MIEFSVESSHENVQIGFQCSQMVECVMIDFVDHACVQIVGIDVLGPDGQNPIEDWDIDIGSFLNDAVRKKIN